MYYEMFKICALRLNYLAIKLVDKGYFYLLKIIFINMGSSIGQPDKEHNTRAMEAFEALELYLLVVFTRQLPSHRENISSFFFYCLKQSTPLGFKVN